MLVLGVVGNSALYLVPLLVGAMVADRGFTEQQSGYVASTDIWGFALSTLVTAFLLDRLKVRHIALTGVGIMIVANVCTTGIHSLVPFAAVRFVSGFGCGLLVAISTVTLGREERPDRNFGLFYAASLLFATVAFLAMPPVIEVFKLDSIYWLFVVLASLAGLAAVALPETKIQPAMSGEVKQRQHWILSGTMLAAIVIFLAQQGALWSYMERIGNRAGLSAVFIGLSLGLSTLTGFVGAALIAWLGNRNNRLIPLLVTMAIQLVALGALTGRPSALTFIAASAVLALCWNIVNPLQLSILADVDVTGKALALSATATGVGMAMGPSIGALSINAQGYGVLLSTVGALALVSVALMVMVLRVPQVERNPEAA